MEEENRLIVELGDADAFHEEEDVPVHASFEVPIMSRMRGLSITGVIVHILGVIAAIIMAIFLVMGYPQNWFLNWEPGNEAALKVLKERVIALALISGALMFSGLAMYTYGRTVQGGES